MEPGNEPKTYCITAYYYCLVYLHKACDIILQVKHNSRSQRKYFTIGPACGISKTADRDHCAKCGSLHFQRSSRSISLGRHVLVQYSYPIALSISSRTHKFNTLHVIAVLRLDVTYIYELAIISCAFRPFTDTPTFKFICVTVQVELEHTTQHHEWTETISREPRSTATWSS